MTSPATAAPVQSTALMRAIVVVCAVFAVWGAYRDPLSTNVHSRLATVESLVHRGTFIINDSPFKTIDMVMIDGQKYSSKPPVLPLLMTAEYWMLHQLGYDITDRGGDYKPWQREYKSSDQAFVIKVLTVTWMGLPFVLLVLAMSRMLLWFVPEGRSQVVALAAVAFGSPALGFALTINNHLPAAAAVVGAAYFSLGLLHGRLAPTWWRYLLAGALAALAPTLDLPAMFFSAALWLLLVVQRPRETLLWFTLCGAVPVLAFHFGATLLSTGSVLPVYIRKELYHYPGSHWNAPVGIDGLDQPKHVYLTNLTIGRKGLFLLYPLLIFFVTAFVAAVRGRLDALRRETIGYGLLVLLWIAFYTLTTNNYGGGAYGLRWFIFFQPLMYLFAALHLARLRGERWWLLVYVLLGISLYTGFQAATHPWHCNFEWTSLYLGPTI